MFEMRYSLLLSDILKMEAAEGLMTFASPKMVTLVSLLQGVSAHNTPS
jgi:hypothetical protein